jgi:hypothetical protein
MAPRTLRKRIPYPLLATACNGLTYGSNYVRATTIARDATRKYPKGALGPT